jgi:hypothetical protein
MSEGAIYWQPKTGDRIVQPPLSVFLSSVDGSTAEIGGAIGLEISGLPAEASSVVLFVGGTAYEAERNGETTHLWHTRSSVPITLRVALGEERIRVKFSRGDSARTVVPRLRLQLQGLAALDTNPSSGESEYNWRLLDRKRPLNLAGGVGRARLFVPGTKSEVFEGPRLVGKFTARTMDFRDLTGWGWPLLARTDAGSTLAMVYVQSLFGKPINKLWLRSPIQPSSKHSVFVWGALDTEPKVVSGSSVASEPDSSFWNFPHSEPVAALAVAYEGICLGSYSNIAFVCDALERPNSTIFGLLRWLRVPLASASLRDRMQRAVFREPIAFVRGWLIEDQLQHGLLFRRPDPGSEAVLRWFLWNYRESREDRLEKIANTLCGIRAGSVPEGFTSSLAALAEICPSLAYNLAKAKTRSNHHREILCRVLAQILRLPPTATVESCKVSVRMLMLQSADTLRSHPEALGMSISAFGDYLDGQESSYRKNESSIRELGERSLGRAQISAALLLRVLEGRRA